MSSNNALYLKTLSVRNFRKFDTFDVKFDRHLTLLTGNNAAGKTAILDAARVALGTYLTRFEGAVSPSISREDARRVSAKIGSFTDVQAVYPVEIVASGVVSGSSLEWTRSLNGPKSRTTRKDALEVVGASEVARQMVSQVSNDFLLPILVCYSTDRLWSQSPKKSLDREDYSSNRMKGYEQCLHASANESRITTWFRKASLWEWQNKAVSPEFSAVKSAIKYMFLGASLLDDVEVDYDVETDAIVLSYRDDAGETHRDSLGSMSDGYRCTLSLIADIAWRMATLNPALGNQVLSTPGVVMIDEVDLHLHPLWQARILGDLRSVFPNVQFIVTTHAPVVVSSVPRGNVRVFEGRQAVVPVVETFGHDANSILEAVLGGHSRPKSLLSQFRSYELAMDAEDYDLAQQLLDKIESQIGSDDPDLVAARTALLLERM